MGFCYLCELEKKYEDVDLICIACMKSYECEVHGQDGDVNCWVCRDRLRDVIHASTVAMNRKKQKEIGVITPREFGLDY